MWYGRIMWYVNSIVGQRMSEMSESDIEKIGNWFNIRAYDAFRQIPGKLVFIFSSVMDCVCVENKQ